MPLYDSDPVRDAMCIVLGFIGKLDGKGLYGSVTKIKDGIHAAKKQLNLTDEPVARLKVMFNVK